MTGLNLRRNAGTDAESLGRLPVGSVAQIFDGPIEADGYTWYALASPGLPYATGCLAPEDPGVLDCPGWHGWVAAGDVAGNPWLEPIEQECPSAPTTTTELVNMPTGRRAYCLADQTVVVDAYLWRDPLPIMDCNIPYTVTPNWLYSCGQTYLSDQTEGGEALLVAIDPALGTCGLTGPFPPTCPLIPYLGHWIEIEGHYDDPAAATCVGHADDAFPLNQAYIVYQCRQALVVTAVRPSPGP